jgi:hypothetical protein
MLGDLNRRLIPLEIDEITDLDKRNGKYFFKKEGQLVEIIPTSDAEWKALSQKFEEKQQEEENSETAEIMDEWLKPKSLIERIKEKVQPEPTSTRKRKYQKLVKWMNEE